MVRVTNNSTTISCSTNPRYTTTFPLNKLLAYVHNLSRMSFQAYVARSTETEAAQLQSDQRCGRSYYWTRQRPAFSDRLSEILRCDAQGISVFKQSVSMNKARVRFCGRIGRQVHCKLHSVTKSELRESQQAVVFVIMLCTCAQTSVWPTHIKWSCVCLCQRIFCMLFCPSGQGRNEVRWRPSQEATLALPCSNLSSFRSKCTVLKKVPVTLGLFDAPRSDSAPGELYPSCPPRYAPSASG